MECAAIVDALDVLSDLEDARREQAGDLLGHRRHDQTVPIAAVAVAVAVAVKDHVNVNDGNRKSM